MIDRYPKAEKFITDLLHELCPSAEIEASYNPSEDRFIYWVRFEDQQSQHTIFFGRDLLDDFNKTLERDGRSTYDEALKNAVRFTAYISLGKAGRMPRDFSISGVLIKERGNWDSNREVPTEFDDRFTRQLIDGLEKLRCFLEEHLAENQDLGRNLEPLQSAHSRMVGLLDYYQKNNHLNSGGVSADTLTLFKAAIIAYIIGQEVRRVRQPLAHIRAAIDLEIYGLVEKLRNTFFLHVPLPGWFAEYQELAMATQQDGQPVNARKDQEIDSIHIFLSHKHDDVKIAEEFKDCFALFGVRAFVAHRDIYPSAEFIKTMRQHLEQLCNVFVPIMTKKFRESDWTDQESGIAITRGLVIAPVKVELNPYGFMGDRQAVRLAGNSPDAIYSACVHLLRGIAQEHPRFRDAVKRCIIRSLQTSGSFDRSGMSTDALADLEPFTKSEVREIVRAVIENDQVWGSGSASRSLEDFLKKHEAEIAPELLEKCRVGGAPYASNRS